MKHLILSTVCMLFCATGLWAQALVDGICYDFDASTQTASVEEGVNKYSGDITIPLTVTYNGTSYSVTSIGDFAFSGCSGLTSITIPNSVTSIGQWAFAECTGLTSIEIPNSVTSIGYYAFSGCTGLTSVTIPNSVTSIGGNAFYNCKGLTSVTIPNSVTSVGWGAFYGTAWYNNQPDGLVYAGNIAYDYKGTMPDNTSVTIKEGTVGINPSVFSGCTGLTSVTIPNSVTSIGNSAFENCTGLTSVTIPNSVTSIRFWAFRFCTGLTSVTIGNGVTSIGDDAFYGCEGLTSINVAEDNLNYASIDGVLYSKDKKTLIKCPEGKTGSVTIPNGVTSIEEYAFLDCTELTSIEIPNSVTSIGNAAFGRCTGLTSVTIGNGVTSIGDDAFYGCEGLTSIEIPNSVTSIGNAAFGRCTGLTSVTIGNGVTSIGDDAFYGCEGLTSIIVSCEKYDYFKEKISRYSSIVYGNCTFEIAAKANNEDYGTVTGNGVFKKGQTIQLTATANEGYRFKGWSDGVMDASREIIVTKDTIITANFVALYTIKALANASQGTVSGGGIYEDGEIVTLVANAKPGYVFAQWVDGNDENPRTVTVNGNKTYTAIFAIDEHNVTANANNKNYGTVTGEGVYEYGTSITLTATPNDHYHFVKWNDNNTQNPRTVAVTQDSTFTAIFAIDEHNVTLSKNISAAGTVTGDGVYEYNTTVQLTATANEGYRFKGWSDGVTDASREITVTKDTSITANFVALYTIKALASASQGTVSGGGVYEKGETATLVANAKPGYIFAYWADGSDENPRYVTVKGNKTYTAIFMSEITAVSETEEHIVETARYDINGRPLTAPTKGVNIVKYSDGSFKKEFVR